MEFGEGLQAAACREFTEETGMRAEFFEAHRVLERYAYGSYPQRVWSPTTSSGWDGDREPGAGLRSGTATGAAVVTAGAVPAAAAAGLQP